MSNVQLVQGAYEAFGRGDLPAVLDLMDSDIEWREAEGNPYQLSGEAWKGPDAIVENLFVKMVADYDGSFVIHPKDLPRRRRQRRCRRALHRNMQGHGKEP